MEGGRGVWTPWRTPPVRDSLAALFESGDARLTTGTPEDIARFFSYFEPPSTEPIPITIS